VLRHVSLPLATTLALGVVAETDELKGLLRADRVRLVLAVRLDHYHHRPFEREKLHAPRLARPRHADDADAHALGRKPGSICHGKRYAMIRRDQASPYLIAKAGKATVKMRSLGN